MISRFMRAYFAHFPRNRCDLMEEDWDNLLILDACRYDLFEQRNTLPGVLEHRLSSGSNTGQFFEANFENKESYDTVYVTANPVPRVDEWCSVDVDSVFYKVIDVWKHHWDDAVNTVRPGPVADAIREASEAHPHKRILGHFIQPHQPFIGVTGREIEQKGMEAYSRLTENDAGGGKKVWELLKDGEVSVDSAWRAYEENLDVVLPYVRDLCNDLTGKTVVTADHGNLFGEFAWPFPVRKYGHPRGIHTRNLIKVPWLEMPFDTRPEIRAEVPVQTDPETEQEEPTEQLRHLGYL